MNPDYVRGTFHGMTVDFVNLWPLLGLANYTGTQFGIDTYNYNWSACEKNLNLLYMAAWSGWTLDMLAGEIGMLLLVVTTWEFEWYFFFYDFPVYFFLLIVSPSLMHAITRLWSRPRLFAVLLIAWVSLTYHRSSDKQLPWMVWISSYNWEDYVVDGLMTYCTIAGLVGTLKGLEANQMFSQRLNPPWAHRRSAFCFAGGIYVFLGCCDFIAASEAEKSKLQNDCDPDLSYISGLLKIMIGLPFIFCTHIFKVRATLLAHF